MNLPNASSANIFQEILETIQGLTGLRTVIYDRQSFTARAGRHGIDAAFAGHRCDFCALVRTGKAGQDQCTASDVDGATQEAARLGEPFLHVCHAGLTEVVMPVVYRGEHVATVFCGQAAVEGSPAGGRRWLTRRAKQLGLAPKQLCAAHDALPRIDRDRLVQIGRLLFLALGNLAEYEGRAALERALALDRNQAVRDAMDYADRSFQQPVRVADVAKHVGLTPAYFCRLFRKVTGITFVDYLTQRRVAEAKMLLKRTHMKMIDVAFEVGYADQSYFGRKFRQITGQTPSEFRKANWVDAKKAQ